MPLRLYYTHLASEGYARIQALEHYLNTEARSEPVLMELVRMRCSIMNDCEYCIRLQTAELKKHHEPSERVDLISGWRDFDAYTHRERAALGWAEAVTNIQDGHALDGIHNEVLAHSS